LDEEEKQTLIPKKKHQIRMIGFKESNKNILFKAKEIGIEE
jgi:hypothetical protein